MKSWKQWLAALVVLGTMMLSGTALASNHSQHMRTPIDWHQSSETVAYPNLKRAKNPWVKVDLRHSRTYIYDGPKLLYTMYSSAGVYKTNDATKKKQSVTPIGTFQVQDIRKDRIYNPSLGLGANYCVAWNGDYMLHSVVTDQQPQHYLKGEAAKLGKAPSSPGCVCLSIPDAQWMEHNLPTGTKVEVVD